MSFNFCPDKRKYALHTVSIFYLHGNFILYYQKLFHSQPLRGIEGSSFSSAFVVFPPALCELEGTGMHWEFLI